jgi:hypothetical protein
MQDLQISNARMQEQLKINDDRFNIIMGRMEKLETHINKPK